MANKTQEALLKEAMEAMPAKIGPLVDKHGVENVAIAMRLLACTKALEEVFLRTDDTRALRAATVLWEGIVESTAMYVRATKADKDAFRAMLTDVYSVVVGARKEYLDKINARMFH